MSQPVTRTGESLDHMKVFSPGCVETRLRELEAMLLQHYVKEDLESFVLECRKQFKTVPMYPLDQAQIIEKFGEKARTEALAILETERKNLVDYQTEHIKGVLQRTIKKLRLQVYAVDEYMKPYKLNIIRDKEPVGGAIPIGNPIMRDIFYVRDHDVERYESICRTQGVLSQFNDFVPYFSSELAELWREAQGLGNLEVIDKEEVKETPKETTEAQS